MKEKQRSLQNTARNRLMGVRVKGGFLREVTLRLSSERRVRSDFKEACACLLCGCCMYLSIKLMPAESSE